MSLTLSVVPDDENEGQYFPKRQQGLLIKIPELQRQCSVSLIFSLHLLQYSFFL